MWDVSGRLVRESRNGVIYDYTYDEASQVREVRGSDESSRVFVHDGLGRRVREETSGGVVREFAWGPTGFLTGITTTDTAEAAETGVRVWVDALGVPRVVGDTGLFWDPAAPVPTLVGTSHPGGGGAAVFPGAGGLMVAPVCAPGAGSPARTAAGGPGRPAPAAGAGQAPAATSNTSTAAGGAAGTGWVQDAGGIRGNQIADPWTVPTLDAAVEGFFGPVAAGGGATLGAAGGLMVGGMEFMGFRVYDPGVRGFVSVDPLAPVLGSGWSGNPYAFAGNDPVGLVDPWGLSPISPAGLEAYNDAHPSGLLDRVGKWVNDNAGAIAVGVLAVGAVAAVFNPVGFVILGGAVLSGGVDIASQLVSNGFRFRDLDWTSTAKATAIGGDCCTYRRWGRRCSGEDFHE